VTVILQPNMLRYVFKLQESDPLPVKRKHSMTEHTTNVTDEKTALTDTGKIICVAFKLQYRPIIILSASCTVEMKRLEKCRIFSYYYV